MIFDDPNLVLRVNFNDDHPISANLVSTDVNPISDDILVNCKPGSSENITVHITDSQLYRTAKLYNFTYTFD